MREIKFRGKDAIGNWWYGNLEIKLKITDEKVWEAFNRSVAEIKGWALPQTSNSTKKERRKAVAVI